MKEDKKPQWLKDAEKELKEFNENGGKLTDAQIACGIGGTVTMSGEHAHKIHSMGGKVSGHIVQPKLHAKNLETGHYDRLHSGEILEKAHNTRKTNGEYKKLSIIGNQVQSTKHLKIYHERVSKILPILPDDWFTRKQAEDIYTSSKVKEEIKAPLGIIKRIITELEFVEDNGKTLRARRYRKIAK